MMRAGCESTGLVNLVINNKKIAVPENTTILDAAEKADVYIPSVCGHPGIEGLTCNLCAVFIEGYHELQLSCSTKVKEGMIIWTEAPRVQAWRKRHLHKVIEAYQSPCLECQRVEPCDSTVCGRKNIPANRRCSTCENIDTCKLRKAARHILGVRVIYRRFVG